MEKNNDSINISFRSKFAKHIQSDIEHDVFVSAFEKFIILDKSTATDILWRMSYTPCSQELWKICLCPETISEEVYPILLSELRHQYEKVHRPANQESYDFWSGVVPVCKEAKTALNELSSQTNIVAASIVYEKCHNYVLIKSVEQIERALFLLNAYKDSNNYGGICELGFRAKEADYLKPFHSKIHDLLEAIFESQKDNKSSLQHKPFESLAAQIENAEMSLPFILEDTAGEVLGEPEEEVEEVQEEVVPESVITEDAVPGLPLFKAITAENVLQHKEVFSSFAIKRDMASLIQLSGFGFDLNQVVAKEGAITNLLKAAEALNN